MNTGVATPRVALFTRSLAGGGAQRVLVNLSRGFVAAGFDVDVVVVRGDGPLAAELPPGVRLINLGVRRALFAVLPLARYFKTQTPHTALATINYANVVAVLARFLSGVRFPLTVREANVLSRDTYHPRSLKTLALRICMRFSYRFAHAVIVNSEDTRRGLIDWRIVSADSIHHIPNPIDLESISVRSEQPPGHPWLPPQPLRPEDVDPPRESVLLAAGRLVRQKDFTTLLDSFALVHRLRPRVRLIILGEGPLRSALEQQVARLGLTEHVSLPGFVENPYSFMRRASLFVLSSRWEGSPNVMIEALACGAAIVATDCPGGARELIGPAGGSNSPGTLIPVADVDAMAHAILHALEGARPARVSEDAAARYSLHAILPRYAAAMGISMGDQ